MIVFDAALIAATGRTVSYQSKHQKPWSHTSGAFVQRAGRFPA